MKKMIKKMASASKAVRCECGCAAAHHDDDGCKKCPCSGLVVLKKNVVAPYDQRDAASWGNDRSEDC